MAMSKKEKLLRMIDGMVEKVRESVPEHTVLPDDRSGNVVLDQIIKTSLDWLKQHGVDRPLEPLANALREDERYEKVRGQEPGVNWPYLLVAMRVFELFGMVEWWKMFHDNPNDDISPPLWLTRIGKNTKAEAQHYCRMMLEDAGLLKRVG
jgi:hypothetical protein